MTDLQDSFESENLPYQISSEDNSSDNIAYNKGRIDINSFLQATQQLRLEVQDINKKRQLQITPIFQHIYLDQTFHILSDFFFDLGFKERKTPQEQILSFSHFKRIVQAVHLPKQQVLIIDLENYQQPMREFSQLQELLMKHRYKRFKILSRLLQEYSKLIQNYQQQIQIVSITRLLNFNNLEDKFILRKQFQEAALKQKFEQLSNEGAFYLYSLNTANIDQGCFQINQNGYSDSLICLLGSDPSQFTQTIMRKGYPEVLAQRNRDIFNIGRFNYELFENQQKNIRMLGCDCTLLTFDDQVIHCSSILEHYFFDYPPELQINGDQFKTEHALFHIFQVSLNSLKQVIAKRQNNKFMLNSDWVNDFGYSMMSEILLEKYYNINLTKENNPEDLLLEPMYFSEQFFQLN